MSGEELAEVRKRPTQTEVEARLLSHIASLSTRTSGMTEEEAWEILVCEAERRGERIIAADMRDGTCELLWPQIAISAILTATSQLSQGNGAEEMRSACVEAIPTNWLDPLLTGPTAVLPKDYRYYPREVENLLHALRKRLSEIPIPPAAKGEVTEEEVEAALNSNEFNFAGYSRNDMRSALLAARKVKG